MIQLFDVILSCDRLDITYRDIKLSNVTPSLPIIQRQRKIAVTIIKMKDDVPERKKNRNCNSRNGKIFA